MHVGIAREPREPHLLPEIDGIQFRGGRIAQNCFGNLLVVTFVFVFFFAVRPSVDAACDVAQLPVGKADERVGDYLHLHGFGHVHGQIFQFRQMRIMFGLRFEDIAAPQPDDRKAFRGAFALFGNVARQLCLHSGQRRLAADYLAGKFRDIGARVGEQRYLGSAENLLGAGFVEIPLAVG